MRRREDFTRAVRSGRRAGSQSLVAHLLLADDVPIVTGERTGSSAPTPARVGFVVSKAVGGAVVRTGVKRRLRHQMTERLPLLPSGSLLVVRANPAAAQADADALGRCLDQALTRVLRPARATVRP
jgi:ribonuclease P protein component